jgi:predicted DNA-binding protein (UPF0251 family)
MPRPKICRRVACRPLAPHFKPQGIPLHAMEIITLGLDELEALRLADFEGLSQEEAAQRMAVSRPTLGRIVESARRRVADALLHGKALRIEGGICEMIDDERVFQCLDCGHRWGEPRGTGRPRACPQCHSARLQREGGRQGPAGGGGCGGLRRRRRAGGRTLAQEDR